MKSIAASTGRQAGMVHPLARLLAIRMALSALAVLVMLLAGLLAYRFADLPDLRRASLQRTIMNIVATLETGEDPARLGIFQNYPRAYGFRVFDQRIEEGRHVIATANQTLLPGFNHESLLDDGDLQTWFGSLPPTPGSADGAGWMLTAREERKGHQYWVQTVMFGDPAMCWFWVILDNLIHHALVPVGLLTPTLTLAIYLTTRTALRPLTRIAEQASAIGGVIGDMTSEPLSATGLPREIGDVVGVINRMLSRLNRSQDQQRHFTADVAHELRTPVAVLLLEVNQLPPGKARKSIVEELLALSAVIEEMLHFAQAEDLLMQERNPTDIAAIARHVCESFAPAAVRRGMSIDLFGAETAPIVLGSAPLIEIAVRNVVDNAIKYAPSGSTVSVTVGQDPHILVEDRGAGIPQAQQGRVFSRFYRAGRTGGVGSGVGLALVQRVMQLHGGEVRFETRTGGGTRFMMTFGPPLLSFS